MNHLPGNIRQAFQKTAESLLYDLESNTLQVILVPAPEQAFTGHMVRLAISHNPTWWKELYNSHQPRKLDRFCFLRALRKMAFKPKTKNIRTYDRLVYEHVKYTLTEVHVDNDVKNYFTTGVPF